MATVGKKFDEFMSVTYPKMLRYTISIFKGISPQDADEIVNEAFYRLWKIWENGNIQNENVCNAWLRKSIYYIALEYSRKTPLETENYEAYSLTLPVEDEKLEQVVEKDSMSEDISKIKAFLKEDEWNLLDLYAFQGYSYTECSEKLGVKETTLRSKINRIRKKIKPLLKK